MTIAVCICTHNPRPHIFQRVLTALAQQTLDHQAFHVCVIDNLSTPALTATDLQPLEQAGIPYRLILETRLGIAYARWCAIAANPDQIIVFVDDDNELAPNYLATAVEIAEHNPTIGCFGGKLLFTSEATYPPWMEPMLPFLAIKDHGDEVISQCANTWGEWEPPTAGSVIRPSVLNLYQERLQALPHAGKLGRSGKTLTSCEDSLMMRGAYTLGLQCSYQPRLVLQHHIAPSRLRFQYLYTLMHGYGRSYVMLDRVLGNVPPIPTVSAALTHISRGLWHRRQQSVWFSLCYLGFDLGYFQELWQDASLLEQLLRSVKQLPGVQYLKQRFPRLWQTCKALVKPVGGNREL
jgi:glycosyltransferase involved in cell wall biosynthesis